MGFIVGSVICYQVLFSDISDRIGEFATLKAMGYSNLRLFRVVVMQGVYLAAGLPGRSGGEPLSFPLGSRGHGIANGPVAERSPGHPSFIDRDVRFLRCLRGAASFSRLTPPQLFA